MIFQRAGRRFFNLTHIVVVEEIPPKPGTEPAIPPPTRVTTIAGSAYDLNGPDAEPLWRRLEEFEADPEVVPADSDRPAVPLPPRSPIQGYSGDLPPLPATGGLEGRGP